ncbi:hypothetical protein RUM43_000107 [Polyplax serrata]|uniref:Uncharacterized protein n=1 Tax=Polyplax serrata TaxID=468196 RepID=A0AAN8SCX3_POLSC
MKEELKKIKEEEEKLQREEEEGNLTKNSKHIEVHYHYVHENIKKNLIEVQKNWGYELLKSNKNHSSWIE